MKKLLLTCAAALMAVGSAWAETTTLYERGVETAWSDADIANNGNYVWGGNAELTTKGYPYISGNGGRTSSLTIVPTANTILTIDAVWFIGGDGNNATNYTYFKIGNNLEFQAHTTNQVGNVVINGNSAVIANACGKNNGNRTDDEWTIHAEINTATKTLTALTIDGKTGTNKVAYRLAGETSLGEATFDSFQFATYRERYSPYCGIISLSVSETTQDITVADYSINYKYEGATLKTVNGSAEVGDVVSAQSPITIEGQKYYATSSPLSMTIDEDAANNVLDIDLRKAENYTYSVTSNLGTLSASGSGTEDETVSYAYSKYILQGTDLYETAKQGSNPWWGKNLLLDQNNKTDVITYNKRVEDVVFYSEAENIEGATSTSAANADIRCSGKAGASNGSLNITTLSAGKYVLYTSVWGNAGATIRFNAGTTEILAAETKGYIQDYNTEEFTLLENTTISFTGADNNHPVDFVYIKKTGEVTEVPVTVGANGFSSFYAPLALDFTGTHVVAYTVDANVAERTVTLTPVDKVPAGTPLIVGGATDNVPVTASADAVETDLQYANAEVTNATAGATVYYLAKVGDEVGFRPLSESGTLAAGKCYFTAPSSAPSFRIVIEGMEDGNQTAISELNAAANAGAMFDLEGRKANGKGLMIQNGKVVLVK